MPTRKRTSSSSSDEDESPAHRSSSHRSNSERDKKHSRRSSSRDKRRRDGKSSKKHSKKSSKSHRASRSRSPARENSSTTDKDRKSSQTSTNQTTTVTTSTNEPLDKSIETNDSNNGPGPTANGHHTDVSTIKTESIDATVPSRVSVRSGVAKRAKDKGLIMEQDIDGLEYSSEEEGAKPVDDLDDIFAMSNKKTKAEMITTNHEKIYYRPFRKDFYTVVPEITHMTEKEVAAYREELDGIKVVGKRCPRPIKAWSQCLTSDKILQCLKKYNYEKPTPIQAQALPIILSGRDMIGIAKTGSGKTLAFVLPMFRHIKDQPPLEGDDGPIAVIMTPTRELALQTTKECKKFAKLFNIRCVAVYGGTGISEQIVSCFHIQ
jgi:ATP-dependent RNA helicase DDX46/PRP5